MGACLSMSKEEAEAAKRSRKLEKMMQEQARVDQETVKLLILGAGESGKSTLFKQMKLLYGKKASDAERRGVTNVIHCNIIQSMQIMLGQIDCLQKDNATTVESESSDSTIDSTADQARTSFSIRLNDKDCRSAANKIRELRMN